MGLMVLATGVVMLVVLWNVIAPGTVEAASKCKPSYRECPDGTCIPNSAGANCPDSPCPTDKPNRCKSGNVCFSDGERCDDWRHCTDGTDEQECEKKHPWRNAWYAIFAIPAMPLLAGCLYIVRTKCSYNDDEIGRVLPSPSGSMRLRSIPGITLASASDLENGHLTLGLGNGTLNGGLQNSRSNTSGVFSDSHEGTQGSQPPELNALYGTIGQDRMHNNSAWVDESRERLLHGGHTEEERQCQSLPFYGGVDGSCQSSGPHSAPNIPTAPPCEMLDANANQYSRPPSVHFNLPTHITNFPAVRRGSVPPPTYEEACGPLSKPRDSRDNLPSYESVRGLHDTIPEKEGLDMGETMHSSHLNFLPSQHSRKKNRKRVKAMLLSMTGSDTDSWTSTSSDEY